MVYTGPRCVIVKRGAAETGTEVGIYKGKEEQPLAWNILVALHCAHNSDGPLLIHSRTLQEDGLFWFICGVKTIICCREILYVAPVTIPLKKEQLK